MLWQRGHFWIAIAGAVLWVLRARFFLFEVRLFGTAMFRVQLNVERSRELIANCSQSFPTTFSCYGNALACPVVPISPTVGAKALAVLATQGKARYREKPRFPRGRP